MSENAPYEPKHIEPKPPLLSDATYDNLKAFNTKVIPAVGALYFALAQVWGFPKGEEVVGTLAIVATFLAVLLGWANSRYDKSGAGIDGTVDVTHGEEGQKTVLLKIETDPDQMLNQKTVNLKVNS